MISSNLAVFYWKSANPVGFLTATYSPIEADRARSSLSSSFDFYLENT